MLDKILKPKKKSKRPVKEKKEKFVSAERFNEMIDFYTKELESRLTQIDSLKTQNEVAMKTSIKSASNADQLRLELSKLKEEVAILKTRLRQK